MSKKSTTPAMLAASLTGNPEAAKRVTAHQAETRFVRALIDMRVAKKLSQRELAKRMGVSPSKVCRLESSRDEALNLGDVFLYLKALGMTMSVMFDDPALPAADRIKHYVFAVHSQLEQLQKLACQIGGEDAISEKIKQFYGEVLFNFVLRLGDSYSKLPGATPIRLGDADVPSKTSPHRKSPNNHLCQKQ